MTSLMNHCNCRVSKVDVLVHYTTVLSSTRTSTINSMALAVAFTMCISDSEKHYCIGHYCGTQVLSIDWVAG